MPQAEQELQQRVIGAEDRVRGLPLPGHTNATRARLMRARARRARENPKDRAETNRLRKLEEMLLTTEGVNVRAPSHVAPPFRATSFICGSQGQVAKAASAASAWSRILGVYFTGGNTWETLLFPSVAQAGQELPKGYIAEIQHVTVNATLGYYLTATTGGFQINFIDAYLAEPYYRLLVNGEPRAPLHRMRPLALLTVGPVSVAHIPGVQGGTFGTSFSRLHNLSLQSPIHLDEGDVVEVEMRLESTAGLVYLVEFDCSVGGYLWPIRARTGDGSARGRIG